MLRVEFILFLRAARTCDPHYWKKSSIFSLYLGGMYLRFSMCPLSINSLNMCVSQPKDAVSSDIPTTPFLQSVSHRSSDGLVSSSYCHSFCWCPRPYTSVILSNEPADKVQPQVTVFLTFYIFRLQATPPHWTCRSSSLTWPASLSVYLSSPTHCFASHSPSSILPFHTWRWDSGGIRNWCLIFQWTPFVPVSHVTGVWSNRSGNVYVVATNKNVLKKWHNRFTGVPLHHPQLPLLATRYQDVQHWNTIIMQVPRNILLNKSTIG